MELPSRVVPGTVRNQLVFVQVFQCGVEEVICVDTAVFVGQRGFEKIAQRTLPRALLS